MSRNAPIAALREVRLSLGGAPLFTGVDLPIARGERIALVGRNGAGKSTLMRILSGLLEPDSGEVFRQPGATALAMRQEPDFGDAVTAMDYASRGIAEHEIYLAEAELAEWGVSPDLVLAAASGGQTRRVALAAAFAGQPDLLMLDEPTNHLDLPAIETLEKRLLAFRGAVLLVSHDRRFMETVTTGVAWLRQGVVRRLDRGYAHFDEWAEQVEEAEERALEKLQTQLKAEERWMARGVTARRKRNMGRVRKLQDMRAERRDRKIALSDARDAARLGIDSGAAGSRLVIETKGLSKSFTSREGGETVIVRNLDLRVMRGDRLGLVGPNGAGKTTLLRMLLGQIPPDSGTLKLAKTLDIAYLDQTRASLNPDETLWDALVPGGGDQVMVRGQPRHVAAYARDFLFDSRQLRQPVHALSGGERNRLTLAIALAKPSNLLVLDEPTNDLDIETLDLLEDMLAEFDGTLILVSHDRAFLDGVVTSILTPEGDGAWLETPGNYTDYLAQKPVRAAAAAASASSSAAASRAAPARPAAKLTYKDQRRLEELDALMPRLAAEIARIEAELADGTLFTKDPSRFETKATRMAAAREELDAAELEWLEIDERRQQLGQRS